MLILEECFWLSVAVVFYVYIGYFFVLKLAIVWGGRKSDVDLTSNKSGEFPINVTVIVAAHNEEKSIEKRINNLLKQSYPPRQLEIIVAVVFYVYIGYFFVLKLAIFFGGEEKRC